MVVDKISHILRASKSIVPLSTERANNPTHILEQQEHIPLVKSRHPTIRARNLPRQCSMRKSASRDIFFKISCNQTVHMKGRSWAFGYGMGTVRIVHQIEWLPQFDQLVN